MNEQFGDRIRRLRQEADVTQDVVGEAAGGISGSSVSQWEKGTTKLPRPENLIGVSRMFTRKLGRPITVEYLIYGDEVNGTPPAADSNVVPGNPITRMVPLISWVQAGQWQQVIDNYPPGEGERLIAVTKRVSPHSFALEVRGDSMESEFPEGCTIIVDPEHEPKNGSFVVVRLEGQQEATFKQLVLDGGKVFLKPLNERYPIIEINDDATICGVVRQMVNDYA